MMSGTMQFFLVWVETIVTVQVISIFPMSVVRESLRVNWYGQSLPYVVINASFRNSVSIFLFEILCLLSK